MIMSFMGKNQPSEAKPKDKKKPKPAKVQPRETPEIRPKDEEAASEERME
jgi:hypothetical protein